MNSRREFLKQTMLGASALTLSPSIFANPSTQGTPKRFIFIHKGNGLFPSAMIPPTLSAAERAMEDRKDPFEVNLKNHDLPDWMSALNAHKENMTILQGLSGKMCTTGHHTWQSSLGVFKATERIGSIRWATVDFELAKMFPSPLEHIELACFPNGGGASRGNINGIERGFSARGPQQPNYAFGSPQVAMQELFKSVSKQRDDQVQYQLQRRLLEFASSSESGIAQELRGLEKRKVKNYANSIDAIRQQNAKLEAMSDIIRRHAPQLDEKYLAKDIWTTDRQIGHTEVLLSTLISGMTNVVTFTIDELGTIYTGLNDIENENVNLHDVGHNKGVKEFEALEVREKLRRHHMSLVDRIVSRLKDVPEDGGTMFDNTMLLYFPNNGETHHSKGTEWPFIVMAGKNINLNISGKYIRLPHYGKEGHKTLGNWYTSILNAHGNPIEHYGAIDTGLTHMNQKGPIKEFLS